jgi:hypothetical protein
MERNNMTETKVVYSNRWGDVINRPVGDCVEIKWFDTTKVMEGDDFSGFLTCYVEQFEVSDCNNGLIDAVQFKMDFTRMNMGWRDIHIVPRYNASGLKKLAFVMPQGMPAIGKASVNEGPANFPTAYFATRVKSLPWLKS